MKKTYSDKMQDARWQKKRLEVLTDADWTCEACGTKSQENGATMHVHHKFYGFAKKREPWEYERHELMALCAKCHDDMPRGNEQWEDLVSGLCYYGLDLMSASHLGQSLQMIIFGIARIRATEDGVNIYHKDVPISAKRRYWRAAFQDFIVGMDPLGADGIAALAVTTLVDATIGHDDEESQ